MSGTAQPKPFSQKIKETIAYWSRAKIAFWILPPLMIMVILGTIAQRYIGLFEAQKLFFSSFILWIGPVPVPGTMTLLLVLNISLALKFICHSKWSWPKSGINLAHLGVLVIFIGGFLTAVNAQEGYLQIFENDSSNIVQDYHDKSLSVKEGAAVLLNLSDAKLKQGASLGNALPFKISILSKCRNCNIVKEQKDDPAYHSMARAVKLEDKKLAVQDEENLSGITFKIDGVSPEQDGIYILMDTILDTLVLKKDGKIFEINYGKEQRQLPFSIQLKDFEKKNYPGTDKPRAYSSDIVVKDGDVEWPVRVEMNMPLRYKGYTLFQSSFIEIEDGKQAAILAVVKNSGWLFPYIGTLITAAGLILHAIIVMRRKLS